MFPIIYCVNIFACINIDCLEYTVSKSLQSKSHDQIAHFY